MNILLCFSALVILAGVAWAYSKTKHPCLTAAKNAAGGMCALLLVNLVSGRTGCYIAINRGTVFVSTVLSLPGVISLLVMKIIFNY